MRRFSYALPVLVLAASCLEVTPSRLTVTIEDGEDFYADGESFRTVIVELPPDTDPGKELTVTTSLGLVDVTAAPADNARRTRTLHTVVPEQGAPLSFRLYAEWDSGPGEVVVEAPNTGLRGVAGFELLPLDDLVTIAVDPVQPVAGQLARVTVALGSRATRPRDLTLETTHGALTPAQVRVSPSTSATVSWQVGAEPGDASITATLEPGGTMAEATVRVVQSPDQVSVEVPPAIYLADGNTIVPVTVRRSSTLSDVAGVVVQTTHGVLNPALTGEGSKQTTIGLRGDESVQVPLWAGREPGQVLVTAGLAERAPATTTFTLTYAPPTLMGLALAGAPVFDRDRTQLAVTASFARGTGQGRPSAGTRVFFATCCDDGGGLGACIEYLAAPPFVTADDAVDEVSATVRLTAAGETLVNQPGNPPADDLAARLYAFALEAEPTGALPTCAALEAGVPAGVAAVSSADLTLRKLARP